MNKELHTYVCNHPTICKVKASRASRRGISTFLLKCKQSGTIARQKGSGCAGKVYKVIKARIILALITL